MKSGKVWGDTTVVVKGPFCEMHALNINPWSQCSKHKHNHKYNLFYVTLGELLIRVWKNDYALVDETLLQPGQWTVVKPGEFHQFQTRDQSCVALEVYYPEGISEDIIRQDAGGQIDSPHMQLFKKRNPILRAEGEVHDE